MVGGWRHTLCWSENAFPAGTSAFTGDKCSRLIELQNHRSRQERRPSLREASYGIRQSSTMGCWGAGGEERDSGGRQRVSRSIEPL